MSLGDRFFVETWGCQMNELDSQRMTGQLMEQGLLPTRTVEEADIILLNSCSVREKAEQKAYSRLGEYRLLKAEKETLVIGFCGCVAEQEGRRALSRVPDLDFVIGTGRVGDLARAVDDARRGKRLVLTGFPEVPQYEPDRICREGEFKGMITVVEGCDKKCTFCIVPTTRGPERCRPIEAIVEEARHLVDYGFFEIELLGQTVNHWRQEHPTRGTLDFADLLDAVAGIPGLRRLRFVTSYPRDFTARMVQAFGRHGNISPYLHLPVQSGSDTVLQRMGRGYAVQQYLDLVAALRRSRPEIALSTDIIVGFPGESEEDFQSTLDLLTQVRFASVYAFKYSERPGTAALRLGPGVERPVADTRLQSLFSLQAGIQEELNQDLVNTRQQVLVTSPGKSPNSLVGRTGCHRVIHFEGDGRHIPLGSLVNVEVTRGLPHSLVGRLLGIDAVGRAALGRAAPGRAAPGRAAAVDPELDSAHPGAIPNPRPAGPELTVLQGSDS